MDRAEALRALIGRVEAGKPPVWNADCREFVAAAVGGTWGTYDDAFHGSRDAAAKLEEPLKARGWVGPFIAPALDGAGINVEWGAPGEPDWDGPDATAPKEAPARFLALLRALLWEAEHG